MATEDTTCNDDRCIVYVLTNPAMPDVVKIGCTSDGNLDKRLKGLWSSGVPTPFRCEIDRLVDNYQAVEAALHQAFEPARVHAWREFFEVAVEQVAAILELLDGEDVTPQRDDEPAGVELAVGQSVTFDGGEGVIERLTPYMAVIQMPGVDEPVWRFQESLRPVESTAPPATDVASQIDVGAVGEGGGS